MSIEKTTIDLGNGRHLEIETGKMALLCNGSVTVRQGDTIVLVAVCAADPRPGIDFFPLQVEYRERFAAAGKIPGGYFKREGRPTEKEILTARMTDRPLRPLFPEGFINEVQVVSTLLSADGENEADVLSILGASAALMVSDIPFHGPVGAVRVGRVNGKFIANPTHPEMAASDIDLVYAGIAGKAIMIEGRADEISEEELRDAMVFADGIVRKQIDAQKDVAARVNKAKMAFTPNLPAPDFLAAAEAFCGDRLTAACSAPDKLARQTQQDELRAELELALKEKFTAADGTEPEFGLVWEILLEKAIRGLVLNQGKRQDGRKLDELREITCEVGLLPRVHGSALFKRGDTQALVTATLASSGDAQDFDVITGGPSKKNFMLHYNFPNFSTGEVGRYGSAGRREIGHGALAERSIEGALPKDYPYTLRVNSEILGSNGSSSMATVCGASLALMDAGVPISDAVVGISVGMVTGPGRREFLTDILGSEDHYGDMDFKVAGTSKGITGFQLDLKIAGLDLDGMYDALLCNKAARAQIRAIMAACLDKPRPTLSPYAPQMFVMKINPEKIGALIGPGGKNIRGIVESTGAQIDVEDDGTVKIFATDGPSMENAKSQIEASTGEVEIGKVYCGIVKSIKDFGAFVEFMPGQEGLVHISEMADHRINKVEDICALGDKISVKVIDIDDRGRVRLSRKAAMAED
ncbi:MAG: polyribonucleotide nucleotidyltransferase [Lentisphaerae bacterium]|jgi:polyribonucleotide nucleotidyltransferase|nr:polyribonucleotide nucleotidyltransferase [Lentisphaerota bacterium]